MKMKRFLLFASLLSVLLSGCNDLIDKESNTGGSAHPEAGTAEFYVLSEGLFNLNNSTLARYTFKDSKTVPDYFRSINRRGLGDTANDMAIYGSKMYIVVNVSSQIEVLDIQTGVSIKQIPLLSENGSSRQPRYITFEQGKAYVCSFDGTIARIDTTSLAIEAYARAGRNPDGICVQNQKLYVSNSGGLDWEGIGVDNTVSVIDIASFTEIKKIEVGPNPGKIQADENGNVYVVTRGKELEKGDYHFVQIDSRTNSVTRTFDQKVLNFTINDNLAYLYNFDYKTQSSWVKVFNLKTGQTERETFITDGTIIQTPYSINVNPYNGNIYITDAYDYKVKGDVFCFNPQGELQFRINNVGVNPNTVVFRDKASQSNIDDTPLDPNAPTAFANRVLAFTPAPSQYMNTSYTAYQPGFTEQQVLQYATELIKDRYSCLFSLGGFGGSITVGFDHTVPNVVGEYDFKIYGNAYYDMYGTLLDQLGGSSEPGIVLVSKDANNNRLADDEWYELAGSEYNSPSTIKEYEITYYRPYPIDEEVKWTDNQGKEGSVHRNTFHTQSYYPAWMGNQITFRGSRLADNAVNEPRPDMPEHWVGYCYDWGYADNHPNDKEQAKFKIDWAVDKEGNPVKLDGIDFVKIYTAVNQNCGWIGEASTEIQAIEDLHYKQ